AGIFRLLRRYARHVTDRWLRVSVRLYEWACVTAMVYLAARIGALLLGHVGVHIGEDSAAFGWVEISVSAAVPATGVALVMIAIVIKNGGRWWDQRRSYRRLGPLWEAVRAVRPFAVLPVSRGRGGARLRLYRRIIEIQDGQLAAAHRVGPALRRQIDEAVAAAGMAGATAHAVRDAAALAAGLAAIAGDREPPAGTDSPAVPLREDPDLAAVVRHLELVSAAYTDSPIVRRFAGEVQAARP
ncbi:MAG TPA: MAB_1171c family putative transporter, partial [Actinoplanes sp.]